MSPVSIFSLPPSSSGTRDIWIKERLEKTLEIEIGGEMLDGLLKECQAELCIPKKDHAVKNPVVVSTILAKAATAGKPSTTEPDH